MTSDGGSYSSWKGWAQEDFGVEGRGDRPYYQRELRELMGADTRKVLEVGFGNGSVLAFGRARGWVMTATELQPELVATAIRLGYDAHDSTAVDDLPDESYDGIVALDVFEHIPPAASIDFLTVLGRKLRVGGHIVLRFRGQLASQCFPERRSDARQRHRNGQDDLLRALSGAEYRLVPGLRTSGFLHLRGPRPPRTDRRELPQTVGGDQ